MFEDAIRHIDEGEYLSILKTYLFSSIEFMDGHELYPKTNGLVIIFALDQSSCDNFTDNLLLIKHHLNNKCVKTIWCNFGKIVDDTNSEISYSYAINAAINKKHGKIFENEFYSTDRVLGSTLVSKSTRSKILFNLD